MRNNIIAFTQCVVVFVPVRLARCPRGARRPGRGPPRRGARSARARTQACDTYRRYGRSAVRKTHPYIWYVEVENKLTHTHRCTLYL